MKYRIAWYRKFGSEKTFHLMDPAVYSAENIEVAETQLKYLEKVSHGADPNGTVEVTDRRVQADYTLSYGGTITHVYKIIEED